MASRGAERESREVQRSTSASREKTRREGEPSGEFPADGEERVVAVGNGVCGDPAGHAGVEHVRATDEAARGRPVLVFSPATGGERTGGTGAAVRCLYDLSATADSPNAARAFKRERSCSG